MEPNETSEVRQKAQRAASEVSALLDAGRIDDALNLAQTYVRANLSHEYLDRLPTDPPFWSGPTWSELMLRIAPYISEWADRRADPAKRLEQVYWNVSDIALAAIASLGSGNRRASSILALEAVAIMEEHNLQPPYYWQEWCRSWKRDTGNDWPIGAVDEEK